MTPRFAISICVFLIYMLAACSAQTPHPPMPEALEFLQSDGVVMYEEVTVAEWDDDSYHVFKPQDQGPTKGFIFYGGSQVDSRSYAPCAYEMAREGYLIVLVSFPKDVALLAPERAGVVIQAFPDIEVWAIGGHSMGGIAACEYAKGNLGTFDAVILWASKPTEENRLDDADIAALSIYATNDGIYDAATIEESQDHLPDDTVWVEIEGGNHFQLGWYLDDHKPIDGDAEITREDQQAQAIAATLDFLDGL